MPCFTGTTAVPCNRINIPRGQPSFIEISTAEVGSIQLEFRDLSRSSNDSKFEVQARFNPFHAVECRHCVYIVLVVVSVVVITNCLERLVSKVTYYVLSGTLGFPHLLEI